MATSIVPTVGIRACVSSTGREPDINRRKTSSSSWWTPLFGWSSEPDYIDTNNKADLQQKSGNGTAAVTGSSRRFTPGCFTEEKARQLRMMTSESKSFHDTMYHSAIASRLAADFKTQSTEQISDADH